MARKRKKGKAIGTLKKSAKGMLAYFDKKGHAKGFKPRGRKRVPKSKHKALGMRLSAEQLAARKALKKIFYIKGKTAYEAPSALRKLAKKKKSRTRSKKRKVNGRTKRSRAAKKAWATRRKRYGKKGRPRRRRR